MAFSPASSYYWKGFRDGAPFILVAGPFGMLFGVLATEAGLNLTETMVMTATVFAGAAQLTALQLMQEHAPTIIVLASALAVNLRMAMYSASLTPFLGKAPLWQRAFAAYLTVDQSYACSIVRFETEPDLTVPQRMGYFMGSVTPVTTAWYAFTLVGALLGAQIPESWALDFALPIAFLAMATPMLRTSAHVVAATVSVVVALLAAGLPYNLGLMVAGLAGMITGARVELVLRKKGLWT
ncbi:AzlC family ABC transporter permease [Antarcticimicrobium luteum]|uniref:Branched-chain amino acid ABC transporter permease n=1 Tax=Antarcticimicrobium luteum TaxID=2547397 RepID=A0A4R5UWS6_9RHOB|nr:AzlC family ABC transporter permease [Antarcticimicrobium luteum]TDK43750.1 branched-chain amino acid ABC transporter permease [Antarcticimicrobium luteum]